MSVLAVTPLSDMEATLRRTGAREMISLAGPGREVLRPEGLDRFTVPVFHDIAAPRDGHVEPRPEHVAEILRAGRAWNRSRPLVIQCWMGVSRSTAAALLVAADLEGGDMAALAARLRAAAPFATPNPLLVRLGDDALGLHGALVAAVAKIGRGAEVSQGSPFVLHLEPGR